METLRKIHNLIDNTNDEICGLYEKYPTVTEMANSDEYKILAAKLRAYEEAFRIVRNDLHEIRNMICEMADI